MEHHVSQRSFQLRGGIQMDDGTKYCKKKIERKISTSQFHRKRCCLIDKVFHVNASDEKLWMQLEKQNH